MNIRLNKPLYANINEHARHALRCVNLVHCQEERAARQAFRYVPDLHRITSLEPSAVLIRTAIWNVVAWNRAAIVMLGDYSALPPHRRNVLRNIFLDPPVRAVQND